MVILGYPGVQALDMVGPFDVFTGATLNLAAQGRAEDGYDVTIASAGGEPVTTGTGLVLVAQPLPDPHGPIDTVVLPGGFGLDEARQNPEVVDWVKAVAGTPDDRQRLHRCVLAAQAGLLDGCRATTHWAFAAKLAREFPSVAVDPEPIYVQSSPTVWTAAGVTAGIDLALALVEDDHGTDVAQTVARYLVLYLRRPGGQSQFAAPVWMPRAKRATIRNVQESIEAEPGVWSCGGGQSAEGRSGLPIRQPASPRARGASGSGFGSSGQNGRKAAGRRTGRRRGVRRADESGRTGDIAHLEQRKYFAFSSPCQVLSLFIRLHKSFTLAHSFCLYFNPLG